MLPCPVLSVRFAAYLLACGPLEVVFSSDASTEPYVSCGLQYMTPGSLGLNLDPAVSAHYTKPNMSAERIRVASKLVSASTRSPSLDDVICVSVEKWSLRMGKMVGTRDGYQDKTETSVE